MIFMKSGWLTVPADAILVFVYIGTDKSESYVPPTTYTTGGFGGSWGCGSAIAQDI
ncbi:MAG: hypothetical protein WCK84_13500 [Bacteroidota bacterium]